MPDMHPKFNWDVIKPRHMPRMCRARLGSAWIQYPVILPGIMQEPDDSWKTMVETLLMVSDLSGYVVDEDLEQAIKSVFSTSETVIDCGILPMVVGIRHVNIGRLLFNPEPVPKVWIVQKANGMFMLSGRIGGPALLGRLITQTFNRVECWC